MGKGGIVSSQATERFTGALIRLQSAQGDGFHGVLSFNLYGADAAGGCDAPALLGHYYRSVPACAMWRNRQLLPDWGRGVEICVRW